MIVGHGQLAAEFRAALEHVVGQQSGITTVAIAPECNREMKQCEICEAADSVDTGEGVVVVTDMFGGSPSNLSHRACNPKDRKILYGANLPMLVKLVKTRHKPLNEAVAAALAAGRKYIDSFEGNA